MKAFTGNQQLVKRINKNLVMQTVIKEAPISRADIAVYLGLNKGTVSTLVQELIEEQLIYESGPGQSSGGRRPVMLLFNEKAGFSIGIDIGVHYVLGVLTDLKGNIVYEINKRLKAHSYQEVAPVLTSVIADLINRSPKSHYGIIGVGIAVPGLVNRDGEILIAPNLGWENILLKEEIEQRFNIPVTMENEANSGAYGEKLYGIGKNFDNILYVSVGIGIGVGVILNGELFLGTNGFAGEAGHMMVQVNGKNCSCGSNGCWELYASERALLEEAKKLELPGVDKDNLSIEILCEMALDGNEGVLDLFKTIGTYLGVGLHNIINTFNPEQVIIGNRLALAKDWLQKPIKEFIHQHTIKWHQENLTVSFSKLMTFAAAIGVSALSAEEFLKKSVSSIEKP